MRNLTIPTKEVASTLIFLAMAKAERKARQAAQPLLPAAKPAKTFNPEAPVNRKLNPGDKRAIDRGYTQSMACATKDDTEVWAPLAYVPHPDDCRFIKQWNEDDHHYYDESWMLRHQTQPQRWTPPAGLTTGIAAKGLMETRTPMEITCAYTSEQLVGDEDPADELEDMEEQEQEETVGFHPVEYVPMVNDTLEFKLACWASDRDEYTGLPLMAASTKLRWAASKEGFKVDPSFLYQCMKTLHQMKSMEIGEIEPAATGSIVTDADLDW